MLTGKSPSWGPEWPHVFTFYYKCFEFSTKSGPIPCSPQAPYMSDIGVVRILIYCSKFEIFEN